MEHIFLQRFLKKDTIYDGISQNICYGFEFASQENFGYFVSRDSPLTDGQIKKELKPTVYKEFTLSNGNHYNDVIAFTYVDDQQIGIYDESNIFRTCYFAKYIGMVKIEFRDGTVFELLRHQVIQ